MELRMYNTVRKEYFKKEVRNSPTVIVEAVRVSLTVPPPPVSVVVTVIEYSVPSSRPVSTCVISLVVISSESVKQSVSVLK